MPEKTQVPVKEIFIFCYTVILFTVTYLYHSTEIDEEEMSMNSTILTSIHKKQFQRIVSNMKSKWNLLYRASEYEFNDRSFNTLCSNKENILCIIKSSENNIFGGFTSSGWPKLNETEDIIKYNSDSNAFLFCFKPQRIEIFPIKPCEQQYAVHSCHGYLCGFGEDGQDLCLSAQCNVNHESWISFDNGSFMTPSGSYLNDGNNWFKVEEIEVFQCVNM